MVTTKTMKVSLTARLEIIYGQLNPWKDTPENIAWHVQLIVKWPGTVII